MGVELIAHAVKNHPKFRVDAKYKCLYGRSVGGRDIVDAITCRELSSRKDVNNVCRKAECPCVWRACVMCVLERKVVTQSSVIDKETGLCDRHKGAQVKGVLQLRRKNGDGKANGEDKGAERRKYGKRLNKEVLDERLARILSGAGEPVVVRVSQIRRFELQPREVFEQQSLYELGMSLKQGQIYPVLLRRLTEEEIAKEGGKVLYELIDGERRWRACKVVGKEDIRAVILDVPDVETQLAISAMANFGRKDHTPIEEARALHFMMEKFGLTMADAVEYFAKSHGWGAQRIMLLQLDVRVQKLLNPEDGTRSRLRIGIALHLAQVLKDDPELQWKCAKHIAEKDMGQRKAAAHIEKAMRKAGMKVPERKVAKLNAPTKIDHAFESLINHAFGKLDSLEEVTDRQVAVALPLAKRRILRSGLEKVRDRLDLLIKRLPD